LTRASVTAAALVALAASAGACRSQSETVLVVVATLSGSAPPVAALDMTLSGSAGSAANRYARDGGASIAFPTTLVAELPVRVTGDITVDLRASDDDNQTIAEGRQGPFALTVGARQTVYVRLDCGGAPCTFGAPTDGGVPGADGGSDGAASCGNGRIDPGETCDTAIAAGAPGACPRPDCDDGIACTRDTPTGDGCTAACAHDEITAPAPGDGCCPAGATSASDTDCSATCGNGSVEAGETCDTALPHGSAGACPAPGDCDDHDPCTRDALVSAGTCAAVCVHVPITAQSGAVADGCCPAGAFNAVDADCPAACGNGILEGDETCETALPAGAGGCPTACDDGDPCTLDLLDGAPCRASCRHVPITARVSGDGCCPPGGNRRTDADCAPSCGNGVVEPGESCDDGAVGGGGGTGSCPTACPAPPSACVVRALTGSAATCSAHCVVTLAKDCLATADGCCPAGCTAATDPDCSPTCGNGIVEAARETCDTAVARGAPGACPASCDDGNACTQDLLVGAGTCSATCVFLPITEPRAGDGCCPPGADFLLDPDCAPVCGNGVTEPPAESCDFAASAGACPTACPPGAACTPVRLEGTPAACNARCVASPITACAGGDGCCPAGCTALTDGDCPAVCGDGVLSPGERCDRAITTGVPGACPASCDDGDACTADFASGTAEGCSRVCTHDRITACLSGDGCCPPGCTAAADRDCAAVCGDGRLEAGETCDPPGVCPTTCPDDGDRCTREQLTGDPARCNARCEHTPITACSGTTVDLCCPTGCTPQNDADC
jgi:hypothetical protein